jgi:hypothetical protein
MTTVLTQNAHTGLRVYAVLHTYIHIHTYMPDSAAGQNGSTMWNTSLTCVKLKYGRLKNHYNMNTVKTSYPYTLKEFIHRVKVVCTETM